MEAELVRLANCEAESVRKDDVISVLREELEVMQMQLDQAQQGGELTPVESPTQKVGPVLLICLFIYCLSVLFFLQGAEIGVYVVLPCSTFYSHNSPAW